MTFYQLSFRAMGCAIVVQLQTNLDGEAILKTIPDQVKAIEKTLTRFDENSELMNLNRLAGKWVKVSQTLLENVHQAKQAARITQGLYNPLVLPAMLANGYDRSFERLQNPQECAPIPAKDWSEIGIRLASSELCLPKDGALDLGGIAKGWTAMKIADELQVFGAVSVNFGGDIVLRGLPQDASGWQIDLEDPHSGDILTSLSLSNTSIVTSGVNFRRWTTQNKRQQNHIVHPKTGQSLQSDLISATVIHPHTPTAEAYAKAILLQGSHQGLNWLDQKWQGSALVVTHDGAVLANSRFEMLINHSNQRINS